MNHNQPDRLTLDEFAASQQDHQDHQENRAEITPEKIDDLRAEGWDVEHPDGDVSTTDRDVTETDNAVVIDTTDNRPTLEESLKGSDIIVAEDEPEHLSR